MTETNHPVLQEPDQHVWVVEHNPGSGWRVNAVLPTYADAEAYEDALRDFLQSCNDDMPDQFQHEVRTRHGGHDSPTKMFTQWPPEGNDD